MRAADVLKLSFLEMKTGRKTLCIGFFLMLFLFAVCLLIYYFSYGFMDNLSLYIMESKREMETVEYAVDDPLEELTALSELGCSTGDVSMISGLSYHAAFFTETQNRLDIDTTAIILRTFHEAEFPVLYGRAPSSADNTAEFFGVWIAPELAEEYGLDVGDRLTLSLSGRNMAEYTVEGIALSDEMSGLMTVPLSSAAPLCRREGLYIPAIVSLRVADPRSYFALKRHTAEKGVTLVSRFELVYAVTDLISDLFRIFSVLCFAIAMTCLISCCRIFISTRRESILLLRTLGMRDSQVMAVYRAILNLMFTASYIPALMIFALLRSSFRRTYAEILGARAAESGNMAAYIIAVFLIGAAAVNLIFTSETGAVFTGKDLRSLQAEG